MKHFLLIASLLAFSIISAQQDTTSHKKNRAHSTRHASGMKHKSNHMSRTANDSTRRKTIRVDDPRGDNLPKTTTDQMK